MSNLGWEEDASPSRSCLVSLAFPDGVLSSVQPEVESPDQLTLLDPTAGHRDLLLPHGDVKHGENRGLTWTIKQTSICVKLNTSRDSSFHPSLTHHRPGPERRQFAAQLVLQLIDQLVDDVVQSERDVSLGRQLTNRAAHTNVEAIDGT